MPGFEDINKEQWASVLPNIRDEISFNDIMTLTQFI